ncbi:MAG: hypothetical protein ABWY25_01420 [Paenisporosarcina sp.]
MSQLEPKIDSTIEDKALSTDDAFKFLSEDAVAEPPVEEEKIDDTPLEKKKIEGEEEEEAKEEDPEKELKEIEEDLEELEEPSQEKLEVVAPVRRREILKKYPTLFKDFPYLEKAYYREQQFTQVFPTIDQAKDAYDKAVTLQNFEDDIVGNGNQRNILKLIKENNPKAFNKVVDDYMENLAEIDEPAYHHVIANLTKHTIKSMWHEGKASQNLKLQEAAVILNQYVFGSSIYKPPVRLSGSEEEGEKAAEISNREREVIRTAFEGASTDVNTRVNNYLKSNIEANIDPSKSMTDYTRKNAVKDAIDKINTLIEKDVRFKGLADRLWEESARNNFSKATLDKISKAFIARGKSLLTPVVKSVRNEALKGSGRKVKDEIEDTNTTELGDKPQPERSRSSKPNKAAAIPKGMSSFDYLMQGDK